MNPLIWENLDGKTRSLDLKIQRCQKPLIKGMTALLTSMNTRDGYAEPEQDSLALLASANYELNLLRKELIKPDLNQRYSHLCKPSVKSTEWLFGDDLPKTVKDLDEQQKAAGAMRQQKGRFFRRFNPTGNRPAHRYTAAGWFRRNQTASQPFLGTPRFPTKPPNLAQREAQSFHKGKQVRQTNQSAGKHFNRH